MQGGGGSNATTKWRQLIVYIFIMDLTKIKSLLFTTEGDNRIIQAFLFEIARYFSSNGKRVVYIATEPISALPATINDAEVATDPEIMRLIQFMYSADKTALEECLGSLSQIAKPPTAIIIENLENYCSEETAALVCSKLIQFGQANQTRLKSSLTLVASYKTPVPLMAVRKFFHNIWNISQKDDKIVVLENINPPIGRPAVFHFTTQDNVTRINLKKVFEAIATKIS